MNEHELRVKKVEELLRAAADELAPLTGVGSPLCGVCRMLLGFAAEDIESAVERIAKVRQAILGDLK